MKKQKTQKSNTEAPKISYILKAAFFSDQTTWDILTEKMKVLGPLADCLSEFNVNVWDKVVYVHLKKNILRRHCPWGVSTFISFKDFIKRAIDEAFRKAAGLTVQRISPDTLLVDDHEINIHSDQLSCDCEHYRSLENYIRYEVPYLHRLIRRNKILKGQLPCPHTVAALKTLKFQSFKDFFLEWKKLGEEILEDL